MKANLFFIRSLVSFVLVALATVAKGQSVDEPLPRRPTYEEGKTVSVVSASVYSPNDGPSQTVRITCLIEVKGDTVIDGKTYKKVWGWNNSEEVWPEFDYWKGSMTKKLYFMAREEGSKIFARALKDEHEMLVFDYAWRQNEVFTFENFYYQEDGVNESGDEVISPCEGMVSSIAMARGEENAQTGWMRPDGMRTYYFTTTKPMDYSDDPLLPNFYEGIGYAGEITPWNNLVFPPPTGLEWSYLNYVQAGDGTVYYDGGHGLYFPQEPVITGIEQVETNPTNTKGSLYDLNGRRLSEIPQSGVYIQDGRVKIAGK